MDFNSLKDSVSNLTLYDLKAGVRKVQNAVMNYTEMEAKVREATNNEPWGASSTLMQEIANGTFNYQTLNEIMPMIYRRFTEKAAEEWRQIYKALQLLEFLIKHGSERVIDDARSHLTLLKMLRQFHFIDPNGKDQGINVRNRAKELTELLSDVDRIRSERKKARANKAKFTGVEGGGGGSFSSSSRYGGFGSDSGGFGGSSASGTYGGYSGGVYGDGGVFGGRTTDYNEAGGGSSTGGGGSGGDKFEEYDEYDEGERPARATATSSSSSRAGVRRTTGGGSISSTRRAEPAAAAAATPPPKKKEPVVDLFSFDEPAPASGGSAAAAAAPAGGEDEDDFDDFQSAAPAAAPAAAAPASSALAGLSLSSPPLTTSNTMGAQFAAPQPVSAPKQANLADMVGMSSISPPPSTTGTGANYSAFHAPAAAAPMAPVTTGGGYKPTQPNYYQSVQASPVTSSPTAKQTTSVFPQPQAQRQTSTVGMAALRPALPSSTSSASKPASGGGDAFGALWSQASTGIKKTNTAPAGPGLSMGQLAQEKSNAAIWGPGSPVTSTPKPAASSSGNGLDDLLG